MDDRRSRLRWRCRRGVRELDEIFERYITHGFAELDERGLDALERLLDEADLDILGWLLGQREPHTEDLARTCAHIRGAQFGAP